MVTKLETVSKIEIEIAAELQKAVLDQTKNLSYKMVANQLGLLLPGATVLWARKTWKLETAMRVAEAFEIDVREVICRNRPAG